MDINAPLFLLCCEIDIKTIDGGPFVKKDHFPCFQNVEVIFPN